MVRRKQGGQDLCLRGPVPFVSERSNDRKAKFQLTPSQYTFRTGLPFPATFRGVLRNKS
jgi:hypothetical protein